MSSVRAVFLASFSSPLCHLSNDCQDFDFIESTFYQIGCIFLFFINIFGRIWYVAWLNAKPFTWYENNYNKISDNTKLIGLLHFQYQFIAVIGCACAAHIYDACCWSQWVEHGNVVIVIMNEPALNIKAIAIPPFGLNHKSQMHAVCSKLLRRPHTAQRTLSTLHCMCYLQLYILWSRRHSVHVCHSKLTMHFEWHLILESCALNDTFAQNQRDWHKTSGIWPSSESGEIITNAMNDETTEDKCKCV